MSGCDMDEKLYAYERLYTIPYQEVQHYVYTRHDAYCSKQE